MDSFFIEIKPLVDNFRSEIVLCCLLFVIVLSVLIDLHKKNYQIYRWLIVLVIGILIATQVIFNNGNINVLHIVLFAVLLLAINKRAFIKLVKNMPSVGLPAMYILTKVEQEIELESKQIIDKNIYDSYKKAINHNNTIDLAIIDIKFKIKQELKNFYDKHNEVTTTELSKLLEFLYPRIEESLEENIFQKFLELKTIKDENKIRFWEIGYEMLLLTKRLAADDSLNVQKAHKDFIDKPKGIEIQKNP
ncbi:hypothetical protein [Bernardetia sp.]|uniref:hypothetical protein n=1 Tax=Bernardetia sp. TaxID=1937974 RepID=UPI0025BE939F|nr:hypothetical protein [Bernardetia sp.]